MTPEAYVLDAIRTPRGRGRETGALHGVKPVTLAAGLLKQLPARHPGLDPSRVDDVVLGVVSPLGDQGGVLPKAAALAAGLPYQVGGLQINRFCASGLEAVNTAALRVRSGWEHLIVAGGVESMSRVPMGSDGGPLVMDPETSHDLCIVPQGVSADLLATLDGFTRDELDAFALRSQRLAAHAQAAGRFAGSVVPVRDRNGLVILEHDEHPRPDTTAADLAGLAPSFVEAGRAGFDAVALHRYHWLDRVKHVHTAGNSAGIVDGAALVLVGSAQAAREAGLAPRARVVAAAVSGGEPTLMLAGVAPAARQALARAGLSADDIDLFEVNEAFAAVVLRFARDLEVPLERVNVNGGAIALGHPLGATGAMLVGTVLDELERRGARRALVAMCAGGGMGVATVLERL